MKNEEHDWRHADLDEVLPVLHLLVVDVVLPHSGAGLFYADYLRTAFMIHKMYFSHLVKVSLRHALVDALQLDEDQRRLVPHVLDLLVDEVPTRTRVRCPDHVLLENLLEFVLKRHLKNETVDNINIMLHAHAFSKILVASFS